MASFIVKLRSFCLIVSPLIFPVRQLPFIESLITEAYTLTRHSGIIPDQAEVAHVRDLLLALEQKGLH